MNPSPNPTKQVTVHKQAWTEDDVLNKIKPIVRHCTFAVGEVTAADTAVVCWDKLKWYQ